MSRSRTRVNLVVLLVFTAVCLLGMEYLAVNIGQPRPFAGSGYTVRAVFADANGVPTAADVAVAGHVVGKVVDVSHDPTQPGYSVVTLRIDEPGVVPVYANGTATVRPKTLLGEKYVDLTVGNRNTADAVVPNGWLLSQQTNTAVENDQIFNAFDTPTRRQEQLVLQALDRATQQRAGDVQAILPQLTTVVRDLQPVARVYEQDQPQVDHILVQLDTLMTTLADEHTQVAGLLRNGNTVLTAVAQRDDALVRTLAEASNVATELNTAMAPTIDAQRASLARLAPTLAADNRFFGAVVDPQAACGGRPCGIDQVFTGTLLAQLNYPNDQLNVTTPAGDTVTNEWDSMFSYPRSAYEGGSSHSALNIVVSAHCDTLTETLRPVLQNLPAATQQEVARACQAVAAGNPAGVIPGNGVPPLPLPPLPGVTGALPVPAGGAPATVASSGVQP